LLHGYLATRRHRLRDVRVNILAHVDILGIRDVEGRYALEELRELVTLLSINRNDTAEAVLVHLLQSLKDLNAILVPTVDEEIRLIAHCSGEAIKNGKTITKLQDKYNGEHPRFAR
jgi:hypothetical protein